MRFALLLVAGLALFGNALADGLYDGDPARDRPGRIYNYVRTNRDGSEPEYVSVFRRDRTHLEVYKRVRNCTNAALVTAVFDPDLGMATEVHGGRLERDAKRSEFAILSWDRAAGVVTATIKVDGAGPPQSVPVPDLPWHVFDFDLASLTVATPHLKDPHAGFSFGMPLIFNTDSGWELKYLGRADATFEREESYAGHDALRFTVGGPAFGDKGGPLWLDKRDGHVLGAEWGIPNHAEYRDFKLVLTSIDDGGAAAWDSLLRAHFDGCK